MKTGDCVTILGAGMSGRLTRITKRGIAWVAVRRRWGGHHKPYKSKTFRYPLNRIAPCQP